MSKKMIQFEQNWLSESHKNCDWDTTIDFNI